MSSKVETSLKVSSRSRLSTLLDYTNDDKPRHTKRALFEQLAVHHDETPHSAAMNMSIDEALLETTAIPTVRFYRWRWPALSFGYFGKFCDVAIYATQHDLVRRWTGGGIVFHIDDLTYSLVIPATDRVFHQPSLAIYEKIHRALADALNGVGERAVVAGSVDCGRTVSRKHAAVNASRYNCFVNPVPADLMMDGRKIAGAAQRRTHRGLLQQGSIQGIAIKAALAQKFADALSPGYRVFAINEEILQRAHELAHQKYGSDSWLRKR